MNTPAALHVSKPERCANTWREASASVALGLALALALLRLLPQAFTTASSQRTLLAVLLGGLLCWFALEACGVHRRFTLGMQGVARPSRWLALPVAFADTFLIGSILLVAPAEGLLAALLRLAHGAGYQSGSGGRLGQASLVLAGTAAAFTLRLDQFGSADVYVIVSSKLLYVAVGELIPLLHRASALPPARQFGCIVLGIGIVMVMPGIRVF